MSACVVLAGCTLASAQIAPAPNASATGSATPLLPIPTSTPEQSATGPSVEPATSASASAPLLLTGEPLLTPLTDPDGPGPAPVGSFVLGDSISLSVAPTLSRLGYPVTGRVGQPITTEFLRQHLASSTAQSAPAWIIVLGTNNRGDETDIARLDDWLATIKDLRSGRPRQQVYWVTPHRPAEYRGGLREYDLDPFNDALDAAAQERRWLHVLDFSAMADLHPEWFAQDGGRLHPGDDGQAALAALIAGPDAAPADQPRAITELSWPTPTPTPTPTPESEGIPEPESGEPDVTETATVTEVPSDDPAFTND